MIFVQKIRNYHKRAYKMEYFPSIWKILFTKKKIIAYYGFLYDKNVGDELVFEAAKRLFPSCLLIPIGRYRPISLLIFEKIIKKRTKGLIIGGGTLIIDNKIHQYNYLRKTLNKTSLIYLHGTGIEQTITEQWETIFVAHKILYGGLRGQFSLNIANESHLNLSVVGDAAFSLFTDNKINRKYPYKKILLNYGTHIFNEDSIVSRRVINTFVNNLSQQGYEVCFLPFHTIDFQIGKELNRMNNNIKLLNIPNSLEEIQQVFNTVDYAIGERLHFIIMAVLSNCPFFSVNYANKHIDFLDSLNLKHCGAQMKDISIEQLNYNFDNRNELFDWYKINKQLDNYKMMQLKESEDFINNIK
ncbi:hypothetical protein FACS1894207_3480 [Bacteroidia bacterium]|nr:hypothetical protein FACS1894207_3480 [Bacteroidia bacterium]